MSLSCKKWHTSSKQSINMLRMEKVANLKENSRNLGPGSIKNSGTQIRNFRNLGLPRVPNLTIRKFGQIYMKKYVHARDGTGPEPCPGKFSVPESRTPASHRSTSRVFDFSVPDDPPDPRFSDFESRIFRGISLANFKYFHY